MTNLEKQYVKKLEELSNHLEDCVNDFIKSQWDRRKALYDEIASLKQQIEAEEKTVSDDLWTCRRCGNIWNGKVVCPECKNK
jgi:rubrerythrin